MRKLLKVAAQLLDSSPQPHASWPNHIPRGGSTGQGLFAGKSLRETLKKSRSLLDVPAALNHDTMGNMHPQSAEELACAACQADEA